MDIVAYLEDWLKAKPTERKRRRWQRLLERDLCFNALPLTDWLRLHEVLREGSDDVLQAECRQLITLLKEV